MRSARSLLALAALTLAANTASAQVGTQSNGPVTVLLNATQASTLALSTSAASTTIAAIAPEPPPTSLRSNVTAAWNLSSGANIVLVGWFATPASALTGSAATSTRPGFRDVPVRVHTRPSPARRLLDSVWRGGSAQLWSVAATPLNSTATTNLDLRLNYTGQLPPNAGTYTGTLNLRAVVQ